MSFSFYRFSQNFLWCTQKTSVFRKEKSSAITEVRGKFPPRPPDMFTAVPWALSPARILMGSPSLCRRRRGTLETFLLFIALKRPTIQNPPGLLRGNCSTRLLHGRSEHSLAFRGNRFEMIFFFRIDLRQTRIRCQTSVWIGFLQIVLFLEPAPADVKARSGLLRDIRNIRIGQQEGSSKCSPACRKRKQGHPREEIFVCTELSRNVFALPDRLSTFDESPFRTVVFNMKTKLVVVASKESGNERANLPLRPELLIDLHWNQSMP